jgi:hypothetical protein
METFVAKTAKFWIVADSTLGNAAVQAGQAVASLCESDYNRLVQWFGGGVQVPYRSPATPGFIKVLITTLNGGWNNGSGGFIKLNPYPETESMGYVFVAELSEMFMSAQNAGWNPSNSKGEALSRLLAEIAYPTAPNAGLFFTAQSWLGTPADPAASGNRHDWVSSNEATDTNFVSIGCGILFLNYLRSQLQPGYSIETLIAASGTTLEAVYQTLTGQVGGFKPFSSLLNRFFPIGLKPAVGDDPFPLLDANQRQLSIITAGKGTGIKVEGGGFAEEQFLGCPRKRYSYTLLGTNDTVTATAVPVGFGIAQIAWTVNGAAATDGATISIPVIVYNPDPTLPSGGSSTNQSVTLLCAISNIGKTLTLSSVGAPIAGQIHLTVGATARDAADSPNSSVSATASAALANEFVLFEPAYQKDAARCASAFTHRWGQVAPPFDHLAQAIAIIFTLPDPPPPEFQRALILVEQMLSLAEKLHEGRTEEHQVMQRFLTRRLASVPQLARLIETGHESR